MWHGDSSAVPSLDNADTSFVHQVKIAVAIVYNAEFIAKR